MSPWYSSIDWIAQNNTVISCDLLPIILNVLVLETSDTETNTRRQKPYFQAAHGN